MYKVLLCLYVLSLLYDKAVYLYRLDLSLTFHLKSDGRALKDKTNCDGRMWKKQLIMAFGGSSND